MDAADEDAQIVESAIARLLSGEYPESIAKDLRQHQHLVAKLKDAFAAASFEQRKRGKWWIIVGGVVSVLTVIIVIIALGSGCMISGPGLLLGLYVLTSGITKVRNSRDILAAASALDTLPKDPI
jgi:hypothetical protein